LKFAGKAHRARIFVFFIRYESLVYVIFMGNGFEIFSRANHKAGEARKPYENCL
jgi:hypothetical protein